MTTCLVTGGAGFIGSVASRTLLDRGYEVVVFDNLDRGHREAVDPRAVFEEGDVRDRARLAEVLERHAPSCAMHFAALAYVGESFDRPEHYFDVNVRGSLALASALVEAGVKALVFSSSCTVYGEPDSLPITEDLPLKDAVSPYGESKLAVENCLDWLRRTNRLSAVCLRYFNAAGATPELGEDHSPETHLVPLAIDAALGRIPPLTVFGTDYPTRDGTCIRDYIHILDLADAHVLAMEKLLAGEDLPRGINLGSETGSTVLEVIQAVERCTGKAVPHRIGERRPGDAPALVASSDLARKALGWNPRHSDLDEIVRSAADWRQNNPEGYQS